MTFIDARLPEQVEINAVRRENEAVEVVRTDGGHEVRNLRHAQPMIEYEVSFPTGGFDATVTEAVYAMWRASRGGLYAFRFRDWDSKNSTLTDEVIGTGDGAETEFQIARTHTVGGVSAVRNITRPASDETWLVKFDGVTQGSGYTMDYDTGLITFDSAPGVDVVVSVTGVYDIPVRFDMTYEATGLASFMEHIEALTLMEVKE